MSCLPGMPCYGPEIYAFYPKGCCNESLVCPVNSNIIVYSGPNLPNTGINTNDTLTVALQKIDVALSSDALINTVLTGIATNPALQVAFCALVQQCAYTPTTTTTTTASPTTTTTTTTSAVVVNSVKMLTVDYYTTAAVYLADVNQKYYLLTDANGFILYYLGTLGVGTTLYFDSNLTNPASVWSNLYLIETIATQGNPYAEPTDRIFTIDSNGTLTSIVSTIAQVSYTQWSIDIRKGSINGLCSDLSPSGFVVAPGIFTYDVGTQIYSGGYSGGVWNTSPDTYMSDGIYRYTTNGTGLLVSKELCNSITTTTTTTSIPTVTIGTQIWTDENLAVTTYRNGDVIPEVTDQTAWANLTTGAWCYYHNNTTYDDATYGVGYIGNNYGKLYNWYAVNDPRGLAPYGFHVPSWDEWNTLVAAAGGLYFAQFSLVETGTTHWVPPNTGATNSTGFSARAGGFRNDSNFYQGPYIPGATNNEANFWTSTNLDLTTARGITIQEGSNVYVDGGGGKTYGQSVRLVKD